MQPAKPSERVSGLALGAWLALVLALGRASVVFGLELTHHGDLRLAEVRLANALPPLLLVAAGIAVGAALALRVAARARAARVLVAAALCAATFLFLAGHLDDDRSRRIGIDTTLGLAALACAALAGLALAAFFTLGRPRRLSASLTSSRRAALPPLALLGLLWLSLRLAFGGLGATMDVQRVEHELAGEGWEVLRAHAEAGPAAGVLSPSAVYEQEGAARPALILSPPALVRRVLPDSDGLRWLVGGAGIDHSVGAELGERLAEHALRFRVRVDGALVSETRLPLAGASKWRELGGGAGLPVRGGARLELETALIDASGREIEPELPIRAGFGGLALERRERVARTRASSENPSIVLVLLDTLRADRTSAYGYARPTTPHLEALAARGVLFEEACATASWTWPSTASILTGLYPEEHGVEDASSPFLAQHLETLPEALQRAGFTTAAWSGSPLIVPDKGFDQGFEFFDASREGRLRRSDLVLPAALEWLGTLRGTRFFLYLHLMEPHAPYVPLKEGRARFAQGVPAGYDPRKVLDYNWELMQAGFSASGERRTESIVPAEEQRWISDLYDGCVWSADHYLGLLLARLEELELGASTIVAVTSDHGEELFDHGLLTHGNTLHRELVRVPLVLAGPGLPRGERVRAPLSGAALGPTLARFGGAPIEGLVKPLDLLADLGAVQSETATLFSTRQGWWNGFARQPLFGLRRGTSVLHFAPAAAGWGAEIQPGAGEIRLYDLERDPLETSDLAPLEPERAKALRDELLARLAGFEERRTVHGIAPDPATLEVLRGLGYVGK